MIAYHDWGTIAYQEAWSAQEALRRARAAQHIPDSFIVCEHPPVFTLGRQDCQTDFRVPRATIEAAGIEIVQANRGGRITYHGPGQLVGYFIFDLSARHLGVRDFVRRIESVLIATVRAFGVNADRDPRNPGIWVGHNKLGAIGLHVRRGITQHGFALNLNPDLTHYRYIIPCGIADRGITSLAKIRGAHTPSRAQVCQQVRATLAAVFYERGSIAENVGSSSLAAGSL